MKKIYLLLLFFVPLIMFAQVKFMKGNIVTNSGEKIECLIKNYGWQATPTSIEYKLTEADEPKKGEIKDIESFEIYDYVKYVRETVKIDKSSRSVYKLSNERNPEFVEKQVFLKQLVTGNANLYELNEGNVLFYIQTNQNSIEPLIYKPYEINRNKIAYNDDYKKQLKKELVCSNFDIGENKAEYHEKYLINVFNQYNLCADPEYVVTSKINKGKFNLNIRPRVNFSSVELSNLANFNTKIDNQAGFGIGVEAEYILPFNRNKWAIIVEPTLQFYKFDKKQPINNTADTEQSIKVNYTTIELPIGVRHYMFMNENSKLFVNLQYVVDIPMNSTIDYTPNFSSTQKSIDIQTNQSVAFGLGYNYQNKYGIEVKYFTNRSLTKTYPYWNSDFNNLSIILSYNLF